MCIDNPVVALSPCSSVSHISKKHLGNKYNYCFNAITDLPTFRIVGDNCDLHQKPTHETLARRAQDHHWFNLYAVKDRVQGLHLADDRPIASISTLPLSTWLPNADECIALRQDFIILAARVQIKHLPWFSCIKSVVADHIPHDYSSSAKQKSEIVSLILWYTMITCYYKINVCRFH